MSEAAGLDVRDFDEGASLYAAYADQRARCPVAYHPAEGGHYLLTGYEDVKASVQDWATFSSATGIWFPQDPRPMAPPIEFDPPEHDFWRSVFRDLLTRHTRRLLEAGVVEQADRLISAFAGAGQADLVAEFAEPIPLLAIAALIGLDFEMATEMRRLGLALTDTRGTPDYPGALAGFGGFALAQVEQRRQRPRKDFLTTVGTEKFNGVRLGDDQIVAVLMSLMVAGHTSTVSALSSLLFRLLSEPGLKPAVVARPGLLTRAIEETVRLDTPLHQFRRRTTTEVRVRDVVIPAGRDVLLNYAAANRDPVVYADPDTFAADRQARPHLGFGVGIHTCIGAALARAELRLAVQRLLDRLPDVELAAGAAPRHHFHGNLLLLDRLQVTFAPRGAP